MCAGVQKVSRPMVRCHEMSQITPTTALVAANSTAQTCQGIASDRGAGTSGAEAAAAIEVMPKPTVFLSTQLHSGSPA